MVFTILGVSFFAILTLRPCAPPQAWQLSRLPALLAVQTKADAKQWVEHTAKGPGGGWL